MSYERKGVTMRLRTGMECRKVFDHLCPFDQEGKLKPEAKRRTLLASNANLPLEIQLKAFVMASAQGAGSPQMVQISYNSAMITGNVPSKIKLPADVETELLGRPTAVGAHRAAEMLAWFVEDFDAQCIFLTLDHYTAPKFAFKDWKESRPGSGLSKAVAECVVEEAVEVMKPVFGAEAEVSREEFDAFVNFLQSDVYGEYRRDFLGSVESSRPAWAMIDTGNLPVVLNFATSREITQTVRKDFDNQDVMIEAELSATGSSGDEEAYEKLTGDALQAEIGRTVLFATFSGADGIAYEIGMKHAAKQGEKHEPDTGKLEAIQRALMVECGRYIPFAQHGGTGAASLARGLVGKNNINTQYLVDGANFLADHVEASVEGIRAGDKKFCGTGVYNGMVIPEAERCVEKIKETGTYGLIPELLEVIGPAGHARPAGAAGEHVGEASE